MSQTRERLRRALSIVVLSGAMAVLLATSPPPDDTTSDSFSFDEISFDGESEVVEGTIGPEASVPRIWVIRAVRVDLRVSTDAEFYVEFLDASGHVFGAQSRSRTDYIDERGPHFDAQQFCQDSDVCQRPATYRIQQLDGEAVSIEVKVGLTFTASSSGDKPDVSMEASSPKVVPRAGAARTTVLATFGLGVTGQDPVAASWLSWDAASCQEDDTPRVDLVRITGDARLRLFSGDEGDEQTTVGWDEAVPLPMSCTVLGPAKVRRSAWVVLEGSVWSVTAELVILGIGDQPAVDVAAARVVTEPIRHLHQLGLHHIRHDEQPPGPDQDPPAIYLLGLQGQPSGVHTRIGSGGQGLVPIARHAGCGRCARFRTNINLLPDDPHEGGPGHVDVEVVVHRIDVP